MKSFRDRRQCYLGIAFLIVLLFECATARYDQHRRYIAAQHYRPWGVKQNAAKISLSNSQQQQQQEVLDAYLMGIRGGSSAYYGDSGNNYYDRDGDRGERYDRGGYEYGRKSGAMGSPAGDDDPYDPDDRKNTPSSRTGGSNALSDIQSRLKNGDRRIGIPLIGIGAIFTMLGVSLFFNKALMRLGNLFFIAGIPATIGPGRTAKYFLKPQKARATACLAAGIFLVFVGWPIFGMALEAFGILNLFGNMFPMFWVIFKNMPFVKSLLPKNTGSNSKYRNSGRGYDPDNDPYGDDKNFYDNGDNGGPDSYY